MTAVVLTLNAGSSSIKFSLFDADAALPACLLRGEIEGLGAAVRFKAKDGAGQPLVDKAWPAGEGPRDHRGALAAIIAWLDETVPATRIEGVGHRVVHGGMNNAAPVVVDDALIADLATLSPLAPLHQPHNLAGIQAARAHFTGVPQVACFDTAFHRHKPFPAEAYALPRSYYDEGVRRYGFHGLSYEYVARRLADIAPVEAAGRVVIAHLGNGASMAALKGGRSVACSLGFSAVGGLPMGTRTGELDPGVLLYLMQTKGMDAKAISDLIYKNSGLKGLSDLSQDMRALTASSDPRAKEAIDYFVYHVRREIGAMAAALGGMDALVFTAGIGEHAGTVRGRILESTEWMGVSVDAAANAKNALVVSTADSRVKVFVVPTDEEAMIARHTIAALGLGRLERASA